MEKAGNLLAMSNAFVLINHIREIGYAVSHLSVDSKVDVGFNLLQQFQMHRDFEYLPSVIAARDYVIVKSDIGGGKRVSWANGHLLEQTLPIVRKGIDNGEGDGDLTCCDSSHLYGSGDCPCSGGLWQTQVFQQHVAWGAEKCTWQRLGVCHT